MSKSANFWQSIEFSEKEFNELRDVVYDLTGIALKDNKREMLYSRLSKRLRQLNLKSFSAYITLLKGPKQQDELGHLVNAVTTNLTRFFRESHHYDHLQKVVIPQIIARADKGNISPFLIWSAGCSSGMEAYSAAMVIYRHLPKKYHKLVKILATDIDTNMINTGKEACYQTKHKETLPLEYQKYFAQDSKDDKYSHIVEEVKKFVHFKYLNLLHKWPMTKNFDVIFCRNVMIYFDKPTRNTLVNRYKDQLLEDGYIYLGHAESLVGQEVDVKAIGKSIFQKFKTGEEVNRTSQLAAFRRQLS
ncbi:protein-glutamate O-methyltransferase [Temperatibacter marinus]|uniref:Chemotaxis protein methyltransferase n=1 Tax=Temperatibacter marinus TaxID=1456591 RepID=A0AA52EB57_9PROT|nr:protein-glutamate O-methyltransferase [Temperatibacter marinus]WND02102.1 protein-glutamate O-methyltransferase [Temperatibacter marinus]